MSRKCSTCSGKGTRPMKDEEKELIASHILWYFAFQKVPMEEWPCEECHGAGQFFDKPKKKILKAKPSKKKKQYGHLRVIK